MASISKDQLDPLDSVDVPLPEDSVIAAAIGKALIERGMSVSAMAYLQRVKDKMIALAAGRHNPYDHQAIREALFHVMAADRMRADIAELMARQAPGSTTNG